MKRKITIALIIVAIFVAVVVAILIGVNAFRESLCFNHEEEISKEAALPSCTNGGYTEEVICKKCKTVISEREAVPPTGHKYENSYKCVLCDKDVEKASEGLTYRYDEENDGYIATGKGECKDTHVVIPYFYNDKPVIGIEGNFENITALTLPSAIKDISRASTDVDEGMAYGFFYVEDLYLYDTAILFENENDMSRASCKRAYLNGELLITLEIPETTNVSQLGIDVKCIKSVIVPASSSYNSFYDYPLEIYDLSGQNSGTKTYDNGEMAVYHASLEEKSILEMVDDFLFATIMDKHYLVSYFGDEKNVVLPQNYKDEGYYIYRETFSYSKMESVVISDGVLGIGDYAFSGCDNLKSVDLGKNVKAIGIAAFSDCDSLTTIEIGNSVETIGSSAFDYCFALTSVYIGDGVKVIAEDAFYYCDKLETVLLGKNVKKIESEAFGRCPQIKTINLFDVEEIAPDAFDEIINMSEMTIGKTMGVEIFDKYDYIRAQKYKVSEDNPYFSEIDGSLYSKDGKILYRYASGNTKRTFEIPSTVETIYKNAFAGDRCLVNISIPNSVKCIESGAFENCYALKYIVIPSSVEQVDEYELGYCASLIEVVNLSSCKLSQNKDDTFSIIKSKEESSLIESGDYVFSVVEGKYYLVAYKGSENEITLPEAVFEKAYSIGEDAFYEDFYIEKVTIPNGVLGIGESSFSNCTSLKAVNIPATVKEIENFAFRGCTSLESVEISEGLTKLNYDVFYDCKSLTEITLPDTLKEISAYVFENCESLVKITIPKSVSKFGSSMFFNCYSLEEVVFEEEISMVEFDTNTMFYGCKSLKSVNLPLQTKELSYSAFYGCSSLEEISIPMSVSRIEYDAFDGCVSLKKVIFRGEKVQLYEFFEDSKELELTEYENALYLGTPNNTYAYLIRAKDINITECKIHPSTKYVGDMAFKDCHLLENVYVYSPIYIDFHNKDDMNLSSLKMTEYENCYYIGNEDNPYLMLYKIIDDSASFVMVHNSTKIICSRAFHWNHELEEISMPNGLWYIGDSAFDGCNNLKKIKLPSYLIGIGYGAFNDCEMLEDVVIPKSVKAMGELAFDDCRNANIYCEAKEMPSGWEPGWNYQYRQPYWYSEERPEEYGNYWHYVKGTVTIWE